MFRWDYSDNGAPLVNVDSRKPGIDREVRYAITPAELVAAIRAQDTTAHPDPLTYGKSES